MIVEYKDVKLIKFKKDKIIDERIFETTAKALLYVKKIDLEKDEYYSLIVNLIYGDEE